MTGKRGLVILVALAVALSASCTRRRGVTGPEAGPGVLMPLAVGNEWTYRSPILESSSLKAEKFFTVRIVGTREIGGEVYFVSQDSTYYRNRDDGLFVGLYDARLGKFSDDLFFKYPVEPGARYTFVSQETGAEVEVKVERTTVTVPAGTYRGCYLYELVGAEPAPRFYFQPGVGLLRAENYDQPGNLVSLVSYSVR